MKRSFGIGYRAFEMLMRDDIPVYCPDGESLLLQCSEHLASGWSSSADDVINVDEA